MIISSPMSKFPKEGLVLFWNFQHGRCQPDDSGVIRDMATPNGWTNATTLTPVNGAEFSYDIGGFAKGISLDGLNQSYSFDGSVSHCAAPADWNITEMHWWRSRSWGVDNPSTALPWGQNGVVWKNGSGGLGWWYLDYNANASYNRGIAIGRMVSSVWSKVYSDHNGETFDKPSDGGGDVLNKWYCGVTRNPYPSAPDWFINGVKSTDIQQVVVNNWAQDATALFGDGPDGPWDGQFGMFARWNRLLSDEEIKLVFDATKGYFGVQ